MGNTFCCCCRSRKIKDVETKSLLSSSDDAVEKMLAELLETCRGIDGKLDKQGLIRKLGQELHSDDEFHSALAGLIAKEIISFSTLEPKMLILEQSCGAGGMQHGCLYVEDPTDAMEAQNTATRPPCQGFSNNIDLGATIHATPPCQGFSKPNRDANSIDLGATTIHTNPPCHGFSKSIDLIHTSKPCKVFSKSNS